LVAQLQFHERLVVTLVRLQLVQVVQRVQVLLVQLVAQQAQVQQAQAQLLQVQLLQVQLLVVVPLELVEHPCLQKKIGVQKNLKQQENLAYLF
jgi:hypothetical protein